MHAADCKAFFAMHFLDSSKVSSAIRKVAQRYLMWPLPADSRALHADRHCSVELELLPRRTSLV